MSAVPSGCAIAELADADQPLRLQDGETIHLRGAAPRRQRDFTLGRHCAHQALRRIGADVPAIPIGRHGAPVWPDGIVGSITHTSRYAAALVAPRARFCAVGVDAERVGQVTPCLHDKLFGREERLYLEGLDDSGRAIAATILFSAKEAYYKACQSAGGPPSFRDVRVLLRGNGFIAGEWGVSPSRCQRGRFAVRNDLVLTLIAVRAA